MKLQPFLPSPPRIEPCRTLCAAEPAALREDEQQQRDALYASRSSHQAQVSCARGHVRCVLKPRWGRTTVQLSCSAAHRSTLKSDTLSTRWYLSDSGVGRTQPTDTTYIVCGESMQVTAKRRIVPSNNLLVPCQCCSQLAPYRQEPSGSFRRYPTRRYLRVLHRHAAWVARVCFVNDMCFEDSHVC